MMRSIQILVLVVISLLGCSKNDENDIITNDSIIGQWQLIERFDGGSLEPIQNIENGEIIFFKSDFLYSNSNYPCTGNYLMNNDNIVEITVSCVSSENLLYTYDFENGYLLFNSYPSTCDEGCYDKYKRFYSE